MLTLRNAKVPDDSAPLNEATKAFVMFYLIYEGNGTRAYQASHPGCRSYGAARAAASRLLRNAKVRALIEQRRERHVALLGVWPAVVNVNKSQGSFAASEATTPERDEHLPTGARDVLGVDSSITSTMRGDGWHVSQLGWVRTMSSAVDDNVGRVLRDFDPYR